MKTPPTLEQFLAHAYERLQQMGYDAIKYKAAITAKYFAWSDNDWHTIKPKRKIKNWKATLTNSLPHITQGNVNVEHDREESLVDKLKRKHGID